MQIASYAKIHQSSLEEYRKLKSDILVGDNDFVAPF